MLLGSRLPRFASQFYVDAQMSTKAILAYALSRFDIDSRFSRVLLKKAAYQGAAFPPVPSPQFCKLLRVQIIF